MGGKSHITILTANNTTHVSDEEERMRTLEELPLSQPGLPTNEGPVPVSIVGTLILHLLVI